MRLLRTMLIASKMAEVLILEQYILILGYGYVMIQNFKQMQKKCFIQIKNRYVLMQTLGKMALLEENKKRIRNMYILSADFR